MLTIRGRYVLFVSSPTTSDSCSPEAIARWRQADAGPHSASPAGQGSGEEGHAILVLRQFVFLLGKEAVKKLIDSL